MEETKLMPPTPDMIAAARQRLSNAILWAMAGALVWGLQAGVGGPTTVHSFITGYALCHAIYRWIALADLHKKIRAWHRDAENKQ